MIAFFPIHLAYYTNLYDSELGHATLMIIIFTKGIQINRRQLNAIGLKVIIQLERCWKRVNLRNALPAPWYFQYECIMLTSLDAARSCFFLTEFVDYGFMYPQEKAKYNTGILKIQLQYVCGCIIESEVFSCMTGFLKRTR